MPFGPRATPPRLLALLPLLCFLASLVSPAAAAPLSGPGWADLAADRPEENLVENPDFAWLEAGGAIQGWVAVDARGAQDVETVWGQGASGRLSRSDRGVGYWRQEVPGDLEPGARYVLSAWVLGEPGTVAFVGIEPRGPGGGGIQRIFRGLAHRQWQPVSMEFVAPPSGQVDILLGAEFSGTVWWTSAFLGQAEELPDRLARIWEERLQRYPRVYTGLVVDARGLGIARSMSPLIVDSEGNLLYTGADASHDIVIRQGIVSYMKDLEGALTHRRLAAHELYPYRLPLVIQGIGKVDDGFDRGVIVRAHDADVVRRHLLRYDFLARYAVVFLVD